MALETSPDLEFSFYLAQKLGLTVGELHAKISNHEFIGWSVYYGRLAQRQEIAAAQARARRR